MEAIVQTVVLLFLLPRPTLGEIVVVVVLLLTALVLARDVDS